MWHSLYLYAGEPQPVVSALLDSLKRQGYQSYDPFAGGNGTPPAFKGFVRQFVAPSLAGWVRILGDPDVAVLPDLSAGQTVFYAWLTADGSGIDVYRDGARDPGGLSVEPPPDRDAGSAPAAPASGSIIPDEFQAMAQSHHVNPAQANKLIDRLTSQLFGKLDRASGGEAGSVQNQARALVTGANRADWNSPAARRLIALAEKLSLPPNWREPDFEAVRDAYQAARMLRKNPRSQLMPDEQAALKTVPNALDYVAVYVGK